MPDILIQINEGTAKFFTLMVEGHFNNVMEFKCNTCIILGYLHSKWNLEGYCIALPKPKKNTIVTPYFDDILNHDTNEGIVVTLQNFVEVNLIPSMWQILQYFHLHIPTILHWSIKRFWPFMSLKMFFSYI
jgi:hypothetical protein